jgi:hypothetical protein
MTTTMIRGGGSSNEDGRACAGPTFSCVLGSADGASAPVGRHLHSDPRFAPRPLINLETLAWRWNVFATRSLLQLSVGNRKALRPAYAVRKN